ncbi:carboxypeptidase-like regulatory domain-containing protein [uncultured Algibacter sp.]|uniref:carboxypeptidase-like regulatory domain-containing protein n=1 Tax=uncultured Algibacter sp. TaxID=298659 RepID=UPI003216AE43
MEQKFNISISKPCSEKFSNFNQTTTGGFCKSCKKNVIDFRSMSDEKLIAYFKQNTGKTCGYFNDFQLKEYNTSLNKNKETNGFKYLKIIGFAFFSMMSLHSIQAQSTEPKIEIIQKKNNIENSNIKKDVVQSSLITGVISDESGPLPGVNIVLKDTGIGTATNFDGEFSFPKALKVGDVLVCSYLGFETQNIVISENHKHLNIIMSNDTFELMGEVEINQVYKSKRSLWQKVKGIF